MANKRRVTPLRALESGRYDDTGLIVGRKPTEDVLNALIQQLWSEQTAQRSLDADIEAMLDDRHDLDLPDVDLESEEVRGGWALELVSRIRQWWPKAPVIRIPAPGIGDAPEDFANDLEEALNALLDFQMKRKRGPVGPFFDSVKTDVIAYARGFAAVLPAPRLSLGFPQPDFDASDVDSAQDYLQRVQVWSKGRPPPLQLHHLPARRTLPVFDGDGLAECFWTRTDRIWSVLERAKAFGVRLDRLRDYLGSGDDAWLRQHQSISCVYYANRGWLAELVGTPRSWPPTEDNNEWIEDLELVAAYPHWLPDRIPVAYFPGMTTPFTESSKKVVSVVYHLRHVITELDRLASMKATVVRTWSWPTPVLKTSLVNANVIEAGTDGRPRPVELAPGLMVTLWGDEDLSFLTHVGQGPDSDELLAMLQRQFDRLGLPVVEHGQGDVSGYAFAQMRAAARGKWSAIEQGLVQGWDDLAQINLAYLRELPYTSTVPALTDVGWQASARYTDRRTRERGTFLKIDPDKLRSRAFILNVVLEPDRSLDLVANGQAALQLQQLGIPKRILWEDVLGFENSTQLRHEALLDEFRDSPATKEALFGEALRAGRIIIETAAEGGGGGLTAEELTQYTPEQIQAMMQAGLVDEATAQAVLAQMAGGIPGAQVAGAAIGGGAPPGAQLGPFNATGGAQVPPMFGGEQAAFVPGAAGLGAVGGAPSPVVATRPSAPLPRGRGRAPGIKRQPGGPRLG